MFQRTPKTTTSTKVKENVQTHITTPHNHRLKGRGSLMAIRKPFNPRPQRKEHVIHVPLAFPLPAKVHLRHETHGRQGVNPILRKRLFGELDVQRVLRKKGKWFRNPIGCTTRGSCSCNHHRHERRCSDLGPATFPAR